MNNEHYIFQPFADGLPSTSFLSRCIQAAHAQGFLVRFYKVNGGYNADRFFYADKEVSILRIMSIDDNENNRTIKFTRISCGEVRGYTIEYIPFNNAKNNTL